MIPKIMNFFWSGARMTFMRYMTLCSFRRCNPNYPVVLWSPTVPCRRKTWTTQEVDDEGYAGQDYTPEVAKLNVERKVWSPLFENLSHSQASDLFEWQLLATIGGIYCDMDVLWIKPLESVNASYWQSDVLYCLENHSTMFAIGFLGASPRCSMFQDVYLSAIQNYAPETYESAGIQAVYQSTGKHHSAATVIEHYKAKYPSLSISGLPDRSLYYFNCRTYPEIFTNTVDLPAKCLGLHWFGGGPVSQQWNRRLTEENYRQYNNTFTRCCKAVLDGGTP